ncbi:MAG: metallophosphoesterase [Candidatus Acidiferrales bacterium]
MRRRIITFIVIAQTILFLGHWLLYETWVHFWNLSAMPGREPLLALRIAMIVLSISFVSTSALAFRYSGGLIRAAYTIAAAWLGVLNYFVFAMCACWIVYGAVRLGGLHMAPNGMAIVAFVLFGAALAVGLYGIVNAAWTRVTRISVKLANLPPSWRGRVAALVSDTHLGHVRNVGFMRRIVRMVARLKPDVVFITGDLYDGTKCDTARLAKPLADLNAPLGTYFITGNHEEFSDHGKYLNGVKSAGVRVLNDEKIVLDDLQVIGVMYPDSAHPEHFRSVLRGIGVDRERASVLLLHAPDRLAIAAEEGISLQLSGHTHGGQFLPWTWVTSRIYGKYVHGLQRLGELTIFTTWGAGTWGPPLRVGTKPEIVLITFE